ncbi:hypothetical protein JW992_09810 [candidate division KSB1 bacterium]|nr:hypothetical protein [candidate division KSB1 bacterium]
MKRTFLSVFALAAAVFAQDGETVRVFDARPRELTAYSVVWVADRPVAADAVIGVVFPSLCNLSQVVMADSRKLNGGVSVSVLGDTVWVQRSGLGATVAAGDTVDISIASIFNPPADSEPLEFQILERRNGATDLLRRLETQILTEK